MSTPESTTPLQPSRRLFLFETTALTLSGTAIALLAGAPRLANAARHSAEKSMSDVQILNAAIGAEHQAVAAYQVGAESGLLQPEVLKTAVKFQGHHKAHAELLAATVKKLGGSAAKPLAKYDFPVNQLKSQADVLGFAAKLERGAVTAYAGAIPKFKNRDLSHAAASILADEAMHWAILLQALGQDPVPGAFFS